MRPSLLNSIKISAFFLLVWKGLLHFVSELNYDLILGSNSFQGVFGLILMASGFVALMSLKTIQNYRLEWLFFASFMVLFLDTTAGMVSKNGMIEQFIEHSLQLFIPLYLFLKMKNNSPERNWKEFFYFALFFTFVGHGLYAVGVQVVPDNFLNMTDQLLGTSTQDSKKFLFTMGILDFIAASAIFFQSSRKIGFWYMAIWGFITALARPLAEITNFDSMEFYTIHLSNFLYRIPHGLVPLFFLARAYGWSYLFKHSYSFKLKFPAGF